MGGVKQEAAMSEPRAPSYSPLSEPSMDDVKQGDAIAESRAASSSPLSEPSDGMMEAYEAEVRAGMQEDDDTLFLPANSPNTTSLPLGTHAQLPRLTSPEADPEADRERIRRENLHRTAYESLIARINKRNQLRKYLDTRNRIWNESLRKARARIKEIEKEKEGLLDQIQWWREAKRKFNEGMEGRVEVVGIGGLGGEPGGDAMMERKEMYEMFFRLEVDELGFAEGENGEEGAYIKSEEDDGDVDMNGFEEVGEVA